MWDSVLCAIASGVGQYPVWDGVPCETTSRVGWRPVSSGCLGGICITHLVVFPCTQVLMCMRTHRRGILCVKILEGSAESKAWPQAGYAPSAPCLSVEVEALHLPEELNVPGAILQLPLCPQKVRNDQGKQWRQGSLPLTSKKMYWSGGFNKAKVSFQCTFSSCLFPKKIQLQISELERFTLPYGKGHYHTYSRGITIVVPLWAPN